MRYISLVLAVGCVIYGVVSAPGKRLRSARYVTEPDRLWWSIPRLLDAAQWTAEGLAFRRRFLTWLAVMVAATIGTVVMWS